GSASDWTRAMKFYPEELALARTYERQHAFDRLSDEQVSAIMARGRTLFHWFKAHPWMHNAVNATLILGIFVSHYFILLKLPGLFLGAGGEGSVWRVVAASAVAGSLYSYIQYTLVVFSLHEGAAHNVIFVGSGRLARAAQAAAANLARLAGGEPEYYAAKHMQHHAKFGTEDDAEFLNFVLVRRYVLTFLPLAAFINFSDFVIHRPPTYTRGRAVSAVFAATYNGLYAYLMYRAWGLPFMLLTVLLFLPHVGFYLDRLRQFTEHNLMPLDNRNGSRSFGLGFWGMLVGGGPWGSPCHWEHHLVPSIPWYQQLLLHRFVVRQLTPAQRRQFLISPVVGFPRLWWRLVRRLDPAHTPGPSASS
ncbi:MAG: fatty acid desaturase, partial [Vicinamibacterales bacterium]